MDNSGSDKKKRKASVSATKRTIDYLKSQGWLCQNVEQNIRRPPTKEYPKGFFFKRDLFGFIDIIAIKGEETVGIQATMGANHSARVKKILKEPQAKIWAQGNRRIEVWTWRKVKAGTNRLHYEPRIEVVKLRPF